MKNAFVLLAALALSTTPYAGFATTTISVDELGNGYLNGNYVQGQVVQTTDGSELTKYFFAGANYQLEGTLILLEPGVTPPTGGNIDPLNPRYWSDVIQFVNGDLDGKSGAWLNFYSDPFPQDLIISGAGTWSMFEDGPEGNNGAIWTPVSGPIGFQAGAMEGGVTYQFISDVPEPATLITGAMMLLPFGASAWRTLRRNRAS